MKALAHDPQGSKSDVQRYTCKCQAHHAITAGQHISQSSGASILSSAAKHIRAFAYLGIRLIAGKGKIEIQAQQDDVEIKARQVIEFIAKQAINVHSDKRIRLQVGPHRIEITPGGGIELFSPKPLQANTGSVMFQAAKVAPPFEAGKGKTLFDEAFVLRNQSDGKPIPSRQYRIKQANGQYVYGVSDKDGHTRLSLAEAAQALDIEISE